MSLLLTHDIHHSEIAPVAFYAGLNLIAFIWIFLWVPETKQLTLEELDRESLRVSFRHVCT